MLLLCVAHVGPGGSGTCATCDTAWAGTNCELPLPAIIIPGILLLALVLVLLVLFGRWYYKRWAAFTFGLGWAGRVLSLFHPPPPTECGFVPNWPAMIGSLITMMLCCLLVEQELPAAWPSVAWSQWHRTK